jgi:hypothetical protein
MSFNVLKSFTLFYALDIYYIESFIISFNILFYDIKFVEK